MHKILFFVSTCLMTIFTVTAISADVIQLSPLKDNTVYEESGGQSLGAGNHTFMGMTSGDKSIDPSLRRTLVAFDLSSIPSNAEINSVQVSFTIDQVPQSATSDFASLHRLLRDWGEGASYTDRPGGLGEPAEPGDATWTHTFYDTDVWDSPGGDYEALASASAPFGSSFPETMTFVSTEGLKADVTAWVKNPAINFGWLLKGDENTEKNARRLGSRENINIPVPLLTIDYTIPSVIDHLSLSQLTASLTNPVAIANAGDGSGRLFIVEQEGVIRIYDLETDTLLATPFLDIDNKVDSAGNEQGLLGLAFHPAFSSNRKFYVYYTRDPGAAADRSVVAMYQASVADPNIADSAEVVIMEFTQNAANHNGGDLHFGQDGYLYIATGDGGGRDDQYSNAQNLDTLKGAILRIDVDGAPPNGGELCGLVTNYAIPPGNPFTGPNDGCDEILHFGLRNPWRFSFDAKTEDMYIADVGQNAWEEVNLVPPGAAGVNYGWSCREGFHPFPDGHACISAYTDPVFEYSHSDGNCSITGGYVYRGDRMPLQGRYVYGDWCTARLWIATRSGESWVSEEWTQVAAQLSSLSSFGQDENCQLYIADREGKAVFRIDIEDSEGLFSDGFEQLNCR
ncbi:PQQ-dependent sugar dehydrogenase [Pseudomonadota bacterium]